MTSASHHLDDSTVIAVELNDNDRILKLQRTERLSTSPEKHILIASATIASKQKQTLVTDFSETSASVVSMVSPTADKIDLNSNMEAFNRRSEARKRQLIINRAPTPAKPNSLRSILDGSTRASQQQKVVPLTRRTISMLESPGIKKVSDPDRFDDFMDD